MLLCGFVRLISVLQDLIMKLKMSIASFVIAHLAPTMVTFFGEKLDSHLSCKLFN